MAFWAVAKCVPQRDRLAIASVNHLGVETFAPRIRVQVGGYWRTTNLFGSYFFCRVVARWHFIERALGVAALVKVAGVPARCPDLEIRRLMSMIGPDGLVRLEPYSPPALKPGVEVVITDGAFTGFRGIFQGMTSHQRECVLLELLGAQREIELKAGSLAPVH
jgi:transcription antitermination factor NusG